MLGLLLIAALPVQDWPRFLGPHGNATSTEPTTLVRSFAEGGPDVRWRVTVGEGYGGAAVRGGEVFLLDRELGEADVLRCFDLETGEERWRRAYPAPGRLDYRGSRGVPWVGEERIFTIGGFGHVTCFERGDGAVVWSVDVAERYEAPLPGWGWAQSPLVVDGRVIVAPMTDEVGLAALDAGTGEEVWRTGPLDRSHSTPVLVELAGREQLVFVSSHMDRGGGVRAFDPGDGSLLWYHGFHVRVPIPPPIRIDDGRLLVTGGYGAGTLLLEVGEGEEGLAAREVFRIPRGSHIHPPIRYGRHLYLSVNVVGRDDPAGRREGGLMCADLSGREVWRTGNEPNMGFGGSLLTDGLLLVQDGDDGSLRLVEPTPDGFRVLAHAAVFEPETRGPHLWAPMALSDGRLLMRSQTELACIDLRAER